MNRNKETQELLKTFSERQEKSKSIMANCFKDSMDLFNGKVEGEVDGLCLSCEKWSKVVYKESKWVWEDVVCPCGSINEPHALAPRNWKSDYQKIMEKIVKVEKIGDRK